MNTECPAQVSWCAGGHRCTATLQGGEHRSDPWTFKAWYGALVVTRIRQPGRDFLEVRVVVRLHGDVAVTRDDAGRLVVGLDLIVRDILAGRLQGVKDAYRRLTGSRVR